LRKTEEPNLERRRNRQRGTPTRGIAGAGFDRVTPAFAPGDKVVIYKLALCSRPFIEGSATIVAPLPGAADLYRVRFEGERRPLVRLAHSGLWQSDPDKLLSALMAHWRDTIAPEMFGGHGTFGDQDW
jgi:hypothetical protein